MEAYFLISSSSSMPVYLDPVNAVPNAHRLGREMEELGVPVPILKPSNFSFLLPMSSLSIEPIMKI